MAQIPLDFAFDTDYSLDSYFVDKNMVPNPLHMILNPQLWGDNLLLVCGKTASGKTHLAHIYATYYKIPIWDGATMTMNDLSHMVYCVIDNVDNMCEETLFHMLNHIKQVYIKCMLTSTCAIQGMPFTTPDVISRLQQAMLLPLKKPSDMVLQNILLKTLRDYGLFLHTDVVSYIIPRLHRSYASVQEFINILNTKSLSEKNNATIPFVKKILDDLNAPQFKI